jgi:O-antigen ligase
MASGNVLTRLCALALLGLVPLTLSTGIEDVFFSAWRAAQAVFLAPILLLAGWRLVTGRLEPKLTWSTLPWALFGAWAFAGVTRSANPWDSLRRGFELAGAVAALWLGIGYARHWPRLRGAAVWSAGLCTLYGLAQVAGWDPMPWSVKFGRAFGTLGNPDYYAGHLLVVMPLLAASVVAGGRAGLAEAALAPLLATGFLLSHVRGAWLAFLAMAGWGAFWIWRGGGLAPAERRWLGRAAAVTGVIAIIIAVASPTFRGRLGSIVSVGGYDATGRRFLWSVALKTACERPFTGWGTGAFKFQFPRHQLEGAKFHLSQFLPYSYSEHAHNELLQFAAELGGIGVALFLWGLIAWLVPWMRGLASLHATGSRSEWWTQWGIGTSIAGAFIYSWVNFPLQIVPTALLFWILMGVSFGRLESVVPVSAISIPAGIARGSAAVAGIAIAVFGASGAWVTGSDLVGSGYLRHVRGQLEADRPQVAYAIALRAERMLPHDYRVYRWLARIAIRKNDQALADEMLATRLRLHPYLADALADRADFDRHNGRNEEALRRYQALLEVAPNFVSAWGEVGAIRFERKEYLLAVEAFRKACEYQDSSAVWHHNLAATLGLLKRYPEALAEDEAAVARDPGFADAWIGVVLSSLKLNHRDRAREAAARAYAISPQDPRAFRLYSQLQ